MARTHGRRRTTLARRPRYFAHSSSCCRPPRGGRRAALLMLRFGTLSTGSPMARRSGGAARDCYGATLPRARAAVVLPTAASAARALAGLGHDRPVEHDRRHAGRRTTLTRRPRYLAHSSSCCRPPRGGVGRRSQVLWFGRPFPTGSSMAEALGRRRTRLLRRHPSLHARAAVVLPTGR